MTGPTSTTMFTSLGTIDSMMDFTPLLTFFGTLVKGKVFSTIFETRFAAQYLVYFFNMASLCMSFVGAAYVAVHTVDAGVSFTKGLFYNYARVSTLANEIATFELIILALFMGWALLTTILALVYASNVWEQLDARLHEAEIASFGIETPLDWGQAIKVYTLLMLSGLTTLISGYALGEVAEELIAYFAEYDDNEKNEGDDKNTGDKDPVGTAVEQDFTFHTVTAVYGFLVLAAISLGGQIFSMNFLSFEDGFTCDLEEGKYTMENTYGAVREIRVAMKSRADCFADVDKIFNILDLNGDGIISKCEDAKFMLAVGNTAEYALRFSGRFTPAALKNVCNEEFDS